MDRMNYGESSDENQWDKNSCMEMSCMLFGLLLKFSLFLSIVKVYFYAICVLLEAFLLSWQNPSDLN